MVGSCIPMFPSRILIFDEAVGPLFLGPLSEIYGRAIVLQLANGGMVFLFCIFIISMAMIGEEMRLGIYSLT